MDSPVSTAPVQRRIRRCPENVLHRAFRLNSIPAGENKTDCENDCDILQCISWAKNLLGETFNY